MQDNLQKSDRMLLDPEERQFIDNKFVSIFGSQFKGHNLHL